MTMQMFVAVWKSICPWRCLGTRTQNSIPQAGQRSGGSILMLVGVNSFQEISRSQERRIKNFFGILTDPCFVGGIVVWIGMPAGELGEERRPVGLVFDHQVNHLFEMEDGFYELGSFLRRHHVPSVGIILS